MIYIAKIIKRTEVTKMVYNKIYKKEIETHYLFDETKDYTCHSNLEKAEESLKIMMGLYDFEVTWNEDCFNFMYGSSSKYHSSFVYPKDGTRIDYFALIEEKELA